MAYKYTPEERAIIDMMLSWCVCATCQAGCIYLQPHHVDTVGAGGKHERNVLPVCSNCHNAVHTKGRHTFQVMMGVNMKPLAILIWDTAKEAVYGKAQAEQEERQTISRRQGKQRW